VEKANILPVIITNHTVTIAAELVSFVAFAVSPLTLVPKENGSRLVGQCEISHPLNPPSSFEDDLDEQTNSLCSPVDDMGETIPHRSNVMYSQADKDLGYEPLKSRICSQFHQFTGRDPGVLIFVGVSRVVLHQCLWS